MVRLEWLIEYLTVESYVFEHHNAVAEHFRTSSFLGQDVHERSLEAV